MTEVGHNTGRIEWQRSEAQFLYSELANVVFPNLVELVSEESFADAIADPEKHKYPRLRDPWLVPVIAARMMSDIDYTGIPNYEKVLTQGSGHTSMALHERYTFWGSPAEVFREGVQTAAHFPISALHQIDLAHTEMYDGRQLVSTKEDVVRVMSSQDFSDFLHGAALARNGYWRGSMSDSAELMATRVGMTRIDDNVYEYFPWDWAYKAPKSVLGVGLNMKPQLNAIREVNRTSLDPPVQHTVRDGVRSQEFSKAASSGCPVARTAPSFNSDAAKAYQKRLLRTFGTSRQELEAPRSKTAIQLGLEAYIGILKKAIVYSDNRLKALREM